jgi:hypothetical protein
MANKREPTLNPKPETEADAALELDSVNADLRNHKGDSDSFRRIIEAEIESKAKKRGRSEPSTSSGTKGRT